MTPRPAADRTRRSPRPKTEDETASERATRRAARGDPQEVEGTEDGKPVTVEFAKDDAHSPRAARGEPQHIEGTEGGEPVEVKFADDGPEPRQARLVKRDSGQSLAPDTTEQEDIVTAGQRQINLIWESTQAVIAVSITMAVIYVSVVQIESQILTSGFFLIIGFYFSRVNHQNIGGIGRKATDYPQPYRGR